jgi:signal transduction histidine kinase
LLSAVVIGILTGVIGSLMNLLLSTSITAVAVPMVLSGLLILLYYFLRFKSSIQPFLLPIIILSLIGISVVWVFNGGINGSNIQPALVILILALISVSDKMKPYIISLFLLLNISAYFIQLLKPDWVTNFPSETDRWIDALVTMIYSSVFIYMIIKYLHTHYKRERLKVETSEKKLMKINTDKDLFISILAHDLKSPFNNLLGLSELLAENTRSYDLDKIETLAESINMSARNTYRLLEDMLLWASAQSGNFPFKPQKLNLEKVYSRVSEVLQLGLLNKDLTIQSYIPADLYVFADEQMLSTILRNLISNAVKFTNKGGRIILSAEVSSKSVTVSVSDNGVGISPEMMESLFVLSRAHTTEGTEKEKGTGLGLFISREFIEKHNGKIWVESIQGQGSIFYFTLPTEA